jgi:hypothetical protein
VAGNVALCGGDTASSNVEDGAKIARRSRWIWV